MKDVTAPAVDQQRLVLPAVAGRMECSNAEFERRCLIYLAEEQDKLMPDNGLIELLCDGVRLAREYSATMNQGNPFQEDDGWPGHNAESIHPESKS